MLRAVDKRLPRDGRFWRPVRGLCCLVLFVCGCDQPRAPAVDRSVLVDRAHFNIPGLEPLEELLIEQGYDVALNRQRFTRGRLKDANILLIGAPRPHDLSNSVAISPDGRVLASGGEDRTIQLWDLDTGKPRNPLRESDWVGPLSFAANSRMLVSGSAEQSVKLWDTGSGQIRAVFKHPGRLRSVAVSPDGRVVASAGDDGVVALWEPHSGRLLGTLSGHTSAVLHVTFSPDGVALATAGGDGVTKLWDVASGEMLAAFTGHRGPVHHTAFASDGRKVASASADGTVKVWDVEAGVAAFTLMEEAASVAFSPDGLTLATGGETTIKLWEARTGQHRTAIETDSDWVRSLGFSPDGELLAWVDDDELVQVWDLNAGRVRHGLPGRLDAIWHPGPAFTDEECETVIQWIIAGGSLLLITDHAPWATPSQCLTEALGVVMSNSNGTIDPEHFLPEGNMGWLVFTRKEGLVGDHPVTLGRSVEERVDNVVTFYGQSLMGSNDFTPLLPLSASALNLVESGARIPAGGHAQALAGVFGKGRVVVFGEAMMFMEAGLTRSDFDNRQLAVNTVRWLSREFD